MPLTTIWKRLTGRHRRRVSFYESQDVMREAAMKPGKIVDLSHFTAQELEQIILNEHRSPRARAALDELESRAAHKSH